MSIIGLVPCGAAKRNYACAARDMYVSWRSRIFVEYVDMFCDDWLMITSKYGPCFQEQIIEPYDDYLGHHSSKYQREWFDAYFPEPFLSMLHRGGTGSQQITVLSLLTRPFRRFLHPALEQIGIQVIAPVANLKTGQAPCHLYKLMQLRRANLQPLLGEN